VRQTLRSALFVAALVIGAIVVFALMFSDDLAAERATCAELGGQIEIVSDAQAPSIVHECVLPGGSRIRL
ncbi:MAG TPA: hypothetical protein VM451_11250, partial [Candidatus Limnocylindria bacterium]|nr:hypothetical protein [Candidatus Limnocylindria bacterium]